MKNRNSCRKNNSRELMLVLLTLNFNRCKKLAYKMKGGENGM
jgi:hypothetical protein